MYIFSFLIEGRHPNVDEIVSKEDITFLLKIFYFLAFIYYTKDDTNPKVVPSRYIIN